MSPLLGTYHPEELRKYVESDRFDIRVAKAFLDDMQNDVRSLKEQRNAIQSEII